MSIQEMLRGCRLCMLGLFVMQLIIMAWLIVLQNAFVNHDHDVSQYIQQEVSKVDVPNLPLISDMEEN